MGQEKKKRSKFVVDRDFQFGFIRKLAALSVFIVCFSFSFLAVVYSCYGDLQVDVSFSQPLPLGLPEAQAVTNLHDDTTKSLFELLWPVTLVSLVVTLGLVLVFGLIVSQKMVGPVLRMRQGLAEIRRGDLDRSLSLRRGDALQPLADEINELKGVWRSAVEELRIIHQLLDSEEPGSRQQARQRLGKIISSFLGNSVTE